MRKTIIFINKQNQKRARSLGYPIDIIAKKKPKMSIKVNSTDSFIRYANGAYNSLVPKKGKKLVYG